MALTLEEFKKRQLYEALLKKRPDLQKPAWMSEDKLGLDYDPIAELSKPDASVPAIDNLPNPSTVPTNPGVIENPTPPLATETGDERQKMLDDANRRSKLALIPAAFAGLGDALVRSSGMGGGSNFLSPTLSGIEAMKESNVSEWGKQKKADEEAFKFGKTKAEHDPASAESKLKQNSYRPILKAAGMTDEEIDKLPASDIDDVSRNATNWAEAKARIQALRDMKKMKEGEKETKPTAAQTAVDREFAKEYSKYTAGGGYADTMTQLNTLEGVADKIAKGEQLSGPIVGNLPGFVKKVALPGAVAAQQDVELSIQRTLKQTLGGQFTEREGTLFMQRGYDPTLSEKENGKKLKRAINQLKIMATAKQQAVDYYEENGTLAGFKGKLYTLKDGEIKETSKDDFYKMMTPTAEGEPGGGTPPPAPAPALGPNEELRTTKDGRKIVYDKTTKKPLREVK